MKRLAVFNFSILLFISCTAGPATCALLQSASLFTDGMVLQQGMAVPVWGWDESGATVTVEFAGQKTEAVGSGCGKWQVLLDPMPASSKPRKMSIGSSISNQKLEIDNILVGEVWLCSGQSNMAMTMPEVERAGQEIAAADFPAIRMFRVPEAPGEIPWNTVDGLWTLCRPDTASSYSATAYYFARRLHQQTGVPVGIIVSAWGGSSVAAWMSREALDAEPVRRNLPLDVIGWRVNIRPAKLYNAMLHPLIPYGLAGVVWYQGESDAEPAANPYLYRLTFPRMIQDWRAKWKRPDLPFYFVQLPNIARPNDDWVVLRESQQAAQKLPQTGMIATIDIGCSRKLHPPNKQDFGERLCNLVLQKEYGFEIDAESPVFQRIGPENGTIWITFSRELKTTDGRPPSAFQVAGAAGVFAEAQARIEGREVIVSSPVVSSPVAVRYAWATDPQVNLCGQNGLPAVPFRTDDLPVEGQNRMWVDLPVKMELEYRYSTAEIACGQRSEWRGFVGPETLTSAERARLVRTPNTDMLQILVTPAWQARPEAQWPVLCWETSDASPLAAYDPQKGCTVTLRSQVFQATDMLHGLDAELTLCDSNGQFRRYRISIQPMRVYGFCNGETRLLGSNLDNVSGFREYRIAVRPDGCAQVYVDSMPLGTLSPEPLQADGPSESVFRWGKMDSNGQFSAFVCEVAIDIGGAYGPYM